MSETHASEPAGRGLPWSKRSYVERLAQLVLAVLVMGGAWVLLRVLGAVMAPVLVSLLIAYMLDTVIDTLTKKGISRGVAVLGIVVVVVGFLAVLAFIVVPVVVAEMNEALEGLPERARQAYNEGRLFLAETFGMTEPQLQELTTSFSNTAKQWLWGAAETVFQSASSLLNAVLIPVFIYYFLKDWDRIVRMPLGVVPERFHARIVDRARRMDGVVGQWLRGQFQVALILGGYFAIALSIVGIRLGFLVGLLAGLLNVIPYLGAAIGVALSLIMFLVGDGSLWQLIGIGIVFGAGQILETYVITPRLVGDKVGMSPVAVLIVLLVGGSLFGFVGLLLAIPAAAAGFILFRDLLDWYKRTRFWRGPELAPAGGVGVAASAPAEAPLELATDPTGAARVAREGEVAVSEAIQASRDVAPPDEVLPTVPLAETLSAEVVATSPQVPAVVITSSVADAAAPPVASEPAPAAADVAPDSPDTPPKRRRKPTS